MLMKSAVLISYGIISFFRVLYKHMFGLIGHLDVW